MKKNKPHEMLKVNNYKKKLSINAEGKNNYFILVNIEIEIWNQLKLNAVRKILLSCCFYYERSIDLFDWALFARVTLLRFF